MSANRATGKQDHKQDHKVRQVKDVRPTSSRVLSALFNILNSGQYVNGRSGMSDFQGMNFLDLFAGTGRVGLTALERGANSVVWVESIRERAHAIESALQNSGSGLGRGDHEGEKCLVLALELRRAVSWLLKRERVFDIIFADPPYNANWCSELLAGDRPVPLEKLLVSEGILVIEHSIRENLIVPSIWRLADQRDYGETRLSFLKPAHAAGA